MDICTKCGKEGYLFQEKIRPTKSEPRSLKRKYDWVKGKVVSYYYKPYPKSRIRHHYWSFIHNIKVSGKWTIRKCYLGIRKESDSNCNCSYCK